MDREKNISCENGGQSAKLQGSQSKKTYVKSVYQKHETMKIAAASTNCAAPDPSEHS